MGKPINRTNKGLKNSDPFRYYCLYDYRNITNNLEYNKISFDMIMDDLKKRKDYIYVSIPIYERLYIESNKIISELEFYYLNVIFIKNNDNKKLNKIEYKCIVKKEKEDCVLFSSDSFKDSFEYCHNLQAESIDKAIKDMLSFYIDNGFDNLTENEIIQLVLREGSKSYNGNCIRKYIRYVINKAFPYYKELKSLKER
ncbi:TPA: hypothetical protein ACGR6T_004753, partial [Klebsiella aerogenes]